jgi:hypothetical protein
MKKLSFILISMIIVFSACKKDDDPKPNLRMTNEVETKDTFYVFTSDGNSMYYQLIWNIYSDEAKKNLVASFDSGVFQDSTERTKFWFPIIGANNLTGNSYWVESVTRRSANGSLWYPDLKGFYHAQGFGWWEEDGKVYTY